MKKFSFLNITSLRLLCQLLIIVMIGGFLFSCKKEKPKTVTNEVLSPDAPANQTTTVQTDPTSTLQTNQTPTVGLEIGDLAPELNLKDSTGSYIKLSSLKSKLVLVDFWATWCKPCKVENKKLMSVYENYKERVFKSGQGFEIYMISVDDKAEYWKKGLIKENYNWKYNLFDEGAGATWAYNVTSIPKNFLINKDGIIIAKNLRDSIVEKTLILLLN